MNKNLLTFIIFILFSYSVLISPTKDMDKNIFNTLDEPSISSMDNIMSDKAITESLPTMLDKWQPLSLFHSDLFALFPIGNNFTAKYIDQVIFTEDVSGFINVMHHKSNYL